MKPGIYRRLYTYPSWLVTLLEIKNDGVHILYQDSNAKGCVSLKTFEELYEFVKSSIKDDFEETGEE